MSSKYRHVLPNLGHFAAYMMKKEPYGALLPLVDRVLISRTDDKGEAKDSIVGTVIGDSGYRLADDIKDPETTRFMGYVDPVWLQAQKGSLIQYEESLKQWGRTWEQRTAPVIVPAQVEQLWGEPDFDEEEDETPTPPRRRKGR